MFSIFVLALFLQVCVLHYSVVGAIIDYAAKKFLGIEHTYKVVKTSLMSAEDYVAKNKDEAVRAYLRIFRSLAFEHESSCITICSYFLYNNTVDETLDFILVSPTA